MKTRIIYAIGSTATKCIVEMRKLSKSDFNNNTIYRNWDIDFASKEIADTTIFTENNFRNRIQNIFNNRTIDENYELLKECIPIEDEKYITSLPILQGSGTSKKPPVSAAVGRLNIGKIKEIVSTDCLDASHNVSDIKNAYVIMSVCGGTSTGLNLEIIAELLKRDFVVKLFLLTPDYFIRQDGDKDDIFKANTVATLLRIFYDLEKGVIQYTKDPVNCSKLLPFIIESRLKENQFAEYSLTASNQRTSEKLFYSYVAKCLFSFLQDENNTKGQSWLSTINNHEDDIKRNKAYFNIIMLYPKFAILNKYIQHFENILKASPNLKGKQGLLTLLSEMQVSDPVPIILNNPSTIKAVISEAISKSRLSIVDLEAVMEYIEVIIKNNPSRSNDLHVRNPSLEAIEEQGERSKKGIGREIGKFFKSMLGLNKDEEDEFEEDLYEDEDHGINKKHEKPIPVSQTVTIQELYTWIIDMRKKFTENLLSLQSIKNLVTETGYTEISPQQRDALSFQEFRIEDVFFKDVVKEGLSKVETNILQNDIIEEPPIISGWSGYHSTLKYNKIVKIESLFYQFRIISKVPATAINYLKNDFIKGYERVKGKGIFCYPDRRLQGLPFSKSDRIHQTFSIWELKTRSKLRSGNDMADYAAAIFALALVSDTVIKVCTEAAWTPIIDINKDPKDPAKKYIEVNYASKNVQGRSSIDVTEALSNFIDDFTLPKSEINLFDTPKDQNIELKEVITASKKQILNLTQNCGKAAINAGYTNLLEIRRKLDINATQDLWNLINNAEFYIKDLSEEYKTILLSNNNASANEATSELIN